VTKLAWGQLARLQVGVGRWTDRRSGFRPSRCERRRGQALVLQREGCSAELLGHLVRSLRDRNPGFIAFERAYKDRGFAILGVSMDDDGWKAVRPFMGQQHLNYPVMLGNSSIAELFGGIEALPTTLLIDRSSRVASRHLGLVRQRDYEAEILKLIAE
jgi:hypothetical protein